MNASPGRILIVDDEPAICWSLKRLLEEEGFFVDVAASAEEGLSRATNDAPDLLILDVRLPGMTGIQALPEFRARIGAVPVVMMTAFGDLQTAVAANRGGVAEYLTKPFDAAQVVAAARRALDAKAEMAGPMSQTDRAVEDVEGEANVAASLVKIKTKTDAETIVTTDRKAEGKAASGNQAVGAPIRPGAATPIDGAAISVAGVEDRDGIVGRSPAMQEVFKKIALVAPTNMSVVISGESGKIGRAHV